MKSCPRCGTRLRPTDAEGCCVRCLLEGGLGKPREQLAYDSRGPSRALWAEIEAQGPNQEPETIRRFGDYELLEEIARGGMGVVYRARQLSLGRVVAVKMILAGRFASEQVIQRFRGEVTAAALLQHPNIVAIHDVGIQEGHHYFSMDYVEGQNLSQLVGSTPLPAAKAARYVRVMAEAIHYAHQRGILHRDLKPSNVLVDSNDQPRITDFGLAKRLDGDAGITLSGQMIGSPNFMPPEQASPHHGKVGRHSDVYGLGVILYHLLTARPPFQAESFEGVITQLLNVEPVTPRLLNSSVPADLETICVKCLQKEPTRRYQSAEELAEELGLFLRHEPIHARPITRAERTGRWCRRNPAIAGLSIGILLLLLAVAIASPIAAYRLNRERQRAEQNLYSADMHGAEVALDDGDLGRARELVEAHRPRGGQSDLRGFEWRLLSERCRGDDLYALRGYTSSLNAVRFSPDGATLVTRSRDNGSRVWDLITRTERFSITNVTSLGEFTSDGQQFACGMGNGSVKLCDAKSGRTVRLLEKAGELVSLINEGKTVATTGGEFIVKFWDLNSGRETFVLRGTGGLDLWGVEFGVGVVVTPDGKKLAISNGFRKGITLWDLATRRILNDSLDRRPVPITFLKLTPDGKILATGGFDGVVKFWKMADGEEALPPLQAHSEPVVSAAFSLDGQLMATASLDQTIKLWQFRARRELETLKGHEDGVFAVAFSGDGRLLASGGQDKTVRFWDAKPKPGKATISTLANASLLMWSPDSKLMAGRFQDQTVRLWDAATLEPRCVLPIGSRILAFSDQGKAVLIRLEDARVQYLDVGTGKVIRECTTAPVGDWSFLTISPDGRTVAIADETPVIRLWDVDSGKIARLSGPTHTPGLAAFSPDGQSLISSDEGGAIALWDVAARQCVVSVAADTVRVMSLAVAPDGRLAASGNSDNTIRLWSLKTKKGVATLNGHKRPVWAVAFSPDGKTLASGSGDHSVRLWNVSLPREVAILRRAIDTKPTLDEEIRSVTFSPDGNDLAAATEGGDLIMYHAAPLNDPTSRGDTAPVVPTAGR